MAEVLLNKLLLPAAPPRRESPAPRGKRGLWFSGLAHVVLLALLLGAWSTRQQQPRDVPLPRDSVIVMELRAPPAPAAAATAPPPAATVAAAPLEPPKPKPKPRPKPKPAAQAAPPPPPPAAPAEPPMELAAAPAAVTVPAPAAPAPVAAAAAAPGPTAAPSRAMAQRSGGGSGSQFPRGYLVSMSHTIDRNKVYPATSRRDRERGTVMVRIQLARDGTVLSATLLQPSGYPFLDREAQDVVRRIGKFPPLPPWVMPELPHFTIDQPIKFGFRG